MSKVLQLVNMKGKDVNSNEARLSDNASSYEARPELVPVQPSPKVDPAKLDLITGPLPRAYFDPLSDTLFIFPRQ